MSANGWLQFAIYSIVLLATVRPVGIYLARVLEGERTWLDPVLRPFERLIYKLCGVNADKEMNWREYAFAMLGFSAVDAGAHLRASSGCRLSCRGIPQHLAAVGTDLAWNTAASFTTNTNWQFYTPESHHELSHRDGRPGDAQLLVGGGGHRGGRGADPRHQADQLRHHRQLLGRHDAHAALHAAPACIVYALLLVWQGVPQNLHAYTVAHPLEQPSQTQTIGQGPVASQEAIKMLGTNGGGFFNANSAHPYENPTPLSNFLQILSIFVIPARASPTRWAA